jgi:hypothetical protein
MLRFPIYVIFNTGCVKMCKPSLLTLNKSQKETSDRSFLYFQKESYVRYNSSIFNTERGKMTSNFLSIVEKMRRLSALQCHLIFVWHRTFSLEITMYTHIVTKLNLARAYIQKTTTTILNQIFFIFSYTRRTCSKIWCTNLHYNN